jgi:hypothetical protein
LSFGLGSSIIRSSMHERPNARTYVRTLASCDLRAR